LPARAAILGGLFFVEKIFLTQFVDLERGQRVALLRRADARRFYELALWYKALW